MRSLSREANIGSVTRSADLYGPPLCVPVLPPTSAFVCRMNEYLAWYEAHHHPVYRHQLALATARS